MRAGGATIGAGGIGSVATHPNAQHRGIATALLEDAIGQMRREGMGVSFLFTGIPGFYERVGYRTVLQPEITVTRAAARGIVTPSSSQTPVRVRRLDIAVDLPATLRIYTNATASACGAIVRTRRTWTDALHWLDESNSWIALDDGGRAIAYVRSRCRPFAHQILEAESAPDGRDAFGPLLAAIGANPCACESLVASVSATHPLARLLRTIPGARETTAVEHPMMLRMLSDEPAVASAFEGQPMYFWNSDRI